MQIVVSLNTCCNVAYLTFKLPHNTTGSLHSHQCHTTQLTFQSHQRLKGNNVPSVRRMGSAFHKVVRWHSSGVMGKFKFKVAVRFFGRPFVQELSSSWDVATTVATIDMALKERGAVPLSRSAGNPSNTMWPAPMSTSVPSGVFIHPAIWPQ